MFRPHPRERPILRRVPFEKISSITRLFNPCSARSITQLMTVEFLLLALALFGGETQRAMCIILLIGLLSGTYSDFHCRPNLVVWENKEWKTWFRRTKLPSLTKFDYKGSDSA